MSRIQTARRRRHHRPAWHCTAVYRGTDVVAVARDACVDRGAVTGQAVDRGGNGGQRRGGRVVDRHHDVATPSNAAVAAPWPAASTKSSRVWRVAPSVSAVTVITSLPPAVPPVKVAALPEERRRWDRSFAELAVVAEAISAMPAIAVAIAEIDARDRVVDLDRVAAADVGDGRRGASTGWFRRSAKVRLHCPRHRLSR